MTPGLFLVKVGTFNLMSWRVLPVLNSEISMVGSIKVLILWISIQTAQHLYQNQDVHKAIQRFYDKLGSMCAFCTHAEEILFGLLCLWTFLLQEQDIWQEHSFGL